MLTHPFPKATFISITPRQRTQIERLVESLIAMLDFIDGDEDFEDEADNEPTLGAPERHPVSWEYAPFGVQCREPGLVRHTRDGSQSGWADGLAGDHEREEENEHGGDILDEAHDFGEDDDSEALGSR